jgi:hypothetical protein
MELAEVRKAAHDGTVITRSPDVRVSMKLPPSWIPLLISARFTWRPPVLRLIAPQMAATGHLKFIPAIEAPPGSTPLDTARAEIERLRPGCARGMPESFLLNGLRAVRFTTDDAEYAGLVTYWVFIALGNHHVSLHFDAKKERWETFKPLFEEMASSLVLEGLPPESVILR